MPRKGAEPHRKDALVRAAVTEIAAKGASEVTVARIAKRAGMSAALAHHYFGSKDQMLLAAMRHILTVFRRDAVAALANANDPKARLEAVVAASFSPSNFRADVVAAWLNFYVQSGRDLQTRRLLRLYHARLRSNLLHALRPLCANPETLADGIGALIDGLYLRHALGGKQASDARPDRLVLDYIELGLKE